MLKRRQTIIRFWKTGRYPSSKVVLHNNSKHSKRSSKKSLIKDSRGSSVHNFAVDAASNWHISWMEIGSIFGMQQSVGGKFSGAAPSVDR